MFGTRDEALALVFDILHETERSSTSNTIDLEQRFQASIQIYSKTSRNIYNYTFRSNLQLFFTASSHFEIPSLGFKLQRVKILSVELGRVTVLSPTPANPRTTD